MQKCGNEKQAMFALTEKKNPETVGFSYARKPGTGCVYLAIWVT